MRYASRHDFFARRRNTKEQAPAVRVIPHLAVGRNMPYEYIGQLHPSTSSRGVFGTVALPATSISTNGFSGFRGILVDDMRRICSVNMLKSHANWTYLDSLKRLE